jgi:hypothetical protein
MIRKKHVAILLLVVLLSVALPFGVYHAPVKRARTYHAVTVSDKCILVRIGVAQVSGGLEYTTLADGEKVYIEDHSNGKYGHRATFFLLHEEENVFVFFGKFTGEQTANGQRVFSADSWEIMYPALRDDGAYGQYGKWFLLRSDY